MSYNKGKIKVESTAKKKKNPWKDDVLYSPLGQWKFPGQITKIPSGDITMQGVPYPVFGEDNLGNSQMMYPGEDYQFPGDVVTEYPQMAYGGTPRIGQIYDRLGRLHSIKSYVPKAKDGGSNINNMSKSFKGRKGPFPQIQTEAEFFSPVYTNIPSPYNGGSFQFGGGARPFATQPTMKQISSYGRPNWPYFIAQFGGADNQVHDDTMEAMGNYPIAPADYAFPTVPGVYGEYFGGYRNQSWPPPYSTPADAPPLDFMNEEDPELAVQRMGGSRKPCYNCGGAYKMHIGGTHKATSADFNQGPEFFTNKMNKFTGALRDTATAATIEQMADQIPPGYHVMPDGSLMSNSEMQYFLGGTPEMFPQANKYEYKDGGDWIQKAVNPAHKGYCTPMTKKTCTPRRKAFAMTMKKHHGFHKKQEGGEMQEAKWQAIIGLVEQGVSDPQDIASALNSEGTYPTTPQEVQGYLEQEQGEEEMGYAQMGGGRGEGAAVNPESMSNIDMYSGAYGEATQNADVFGGLANFLNASTNLQNGGTGNINQKQFQSWLDEYFKSNPNARGQAPGRNMNGYGYLPANSSPYVKIKNKNYYNGVPQKGSQPSVSAPGYGKVSSNYGRGFLGLGPTRLKSIDYEWGTGSGLPADSQAYINENPLNRNGKRTTWAGNKLRGLTANVDKYGTPFPSKRRKEDAAFDEKYAANQANQASNAFGMSLQNPNKAAGDSQFSKDEKMRTSDAWQQNVQDKKLIPWLQETAGRLGVSPESLVNPSISSPQVGPAPVAQSAGSTSMIDRNASTPEFVKQTEAYLSDLEKRHPSPTRKWFLGKKTYPEGSKKWGGNYQTGGENPFAFNINDYEEDPNADSENLPGYVPGPTLNDQQVGEVFGEQQDSMNPGSMFSKGRIKFGNRMQGEDAANWGIAGMELGANIFSQDERRNAEDQLKKRFKAENIFSSREDRDRGDYTTNYGLFRPDQQNVGNMVTGKFGGSYQEGGEYELSDEEIQRLRDGGYEIELI